MRNLNKKGFTLIELLAVIVILAVLLAIAIPAVGNYITTSKKSGFVDNVIQYIDAARKAATIGDYELPADANTATVISFSELLDQLDKGGKTSPYGGTWTAQSYVVIVNEGSNEKPRYVYYAAAYDGKYGIGYASGGSGAAQIVMEGDLDNKDVVRIKTNSVTAPTTTTKYNITAGASGNAGKQLTVNASGTVTVGTVY